MAQTIRIKRSSGSSAPSTLANAELAYSEGGDGALYIGVGTGGSGGSATSIVQIGGPSVAAAVTTTRAAGYVFAGPTTGSNAVPSWRALVATDIPDLSATYLKSAVTSVGLSLPNVFTVSGSPVTSSGTLSASLATQVANRVFAGPTSGADAAPTFRALAAGDIPDLSAKYLPLSGGTISSNLTISGNLTVNGTTTTINSTVVAVDDINITLGDTASPSDATADGGGITLKGTTDKTLNWVDATDAWTSSEHFNLASGKAYYINGTSVLSGSTLGSGVTASSLTSVGTISSGTWQGTAVAVGYGGLGLTSAVSGLLKGNGSSYSAATAGTDYLTPSSDIDGGSYP